LTEKWIKKYIKKLHDNLKKIKLSYLIYEKKLILIVCKNLFNNTYTNKIEEYSVNNVYYKFFFNILDKQEEPFYLKFSLLLKEISKINIRYNEKMYKLVTKIHKQAITLE